MIIDHPHVTLGCKAIYPDEASRPTRHSWPGAAVCGPPRGTGCPPTPKGKSYSDTLNAERVVPAVSDGAVVVGGTSG